MSSPTHESADGAQETGVADVRRVREKIAAQYNGDLKKHVAETEAIVYCPHCGEPNEVALDPGSGDDQEYVEDCQVCCRPWLMYVKYGSDGAAEVEVYASDS